MTHATGPRSGRTTLASTSLTRMSAVSVPCSSVALKAISGTPEIGDESLAAGAGWPLEEPIAMDVSDLREVYVIGAAGDVIGWLILKFE